MKLDERGWRVPKKAGTVTRHIYELMVKGLSGSEIAKRVRRDIIYVCVVSWRLRHPKEANEARKKKVAK